MMRIYFVAVFLLLIGACSAMNENDTLKLTYSDNAIIKKIVKNYDVDKSTFRKIVAKNNSEFKGIRVYQAYSSDWLAMDPPGQPDSYYVTPSGKIFLIISEALSELNYHPGSSEDAMALALLIAKQDINDSCEIIVDPSININSISNEVLQKSNVAAPEVVESDNNYTATVFSYTSKVTQNKFERGYRAVRSHEIIIENGKYSSDYDVLWEEKD